jgi:uncharacterized membrane protein
MFCASSPPHDVCDVKQWGSSVFALDPNATQDFTIPITMPNNQISYIATIQHANPNPPDPSNPWITDDYVTCNIGLTSTGVAQGKITANSCPTHLDSGQTTSIAITCKNIGTSSGSFALMFCAASPSASCDVKQWGSSVFALDPNATQDFTIPITMPNNQISYMATIQHANPNPPDPLNPWITDDSVTCNIGLTSTGVAQGQIMSNICPTSLDAGQTTGITITYKNIGTVSGIFALTFCASSPSASCDVSLPTPEEFQLNPEMTKEVSLSITMPNSPISYSAILKHKNPADLTNWITDDNVSCDISLTSPSVSEAGGSPILIIGLAIGALVMMMSKKKQ